MTTIPSLFQSQKLTIIALLIANVIPLIGVLFFSWDLQSVMLLYWLENLIVGVVNVVRIVFIAQENVFATRIFMAVFFCVHYGIFCLGHGVLLFDLLSIEIEGLSGGLSPFSFITDFSLYYAFLSQTLMATGMLALFGLAVSHAFSLRTHYFKGGERLRVTVSAAMSMPYKRILVMHVGLIVGAILIEKFGSTMVLLMAMIVIKIIVDIQFHRKEHSALTPQLD